MIARFILFCLIVGLTLDSELTSHCGAGEPVRVEQVLVRLIEEVEVPAREAGALQEILVKVGDAVHAGDPLARLDSTIQKLDTEKARLELAISQYEAENELPVQLAAKSVDVQKQTAREHDVKRRIAHERADDQVKVQSTHKKAEVTLKDLQRALQARKEFADSISDSEIDTRQLNADQAGLEFQEATLERTINGMLAEAEDLAQTNQQLAVERTQLELANAKALHDIDVLDVKVKENQLATAQASLDRRSINSPIDGIVVELQRHMGEWVQPGDMLARVIRLDRLRAEGFLAATQAQRIRQGARVHVIVSEQNSRPVRLEGIVTFISPEIDPVNQEVRIWAEFDNPKAILLPGMHCVLEIPTGEAAEDSASRDR